MTALRVEQSAVDEPLDPPPPLDAADERREGLRWLAFLRWWAATGAMSGVLLAMALQWTFVSAPAIVGAVLVMVVVNAVFLWRTRSDRPVGPNELLLHASFDLVLLTWLLAWSGGVKNPLSVVYSFHVVLGALLSGRRGALVASGSSVLCMGVLLALEEGGSLPTGPLDQPPALLWILALGLLVVGLGYLSLVVAERLFTVNARALMQKKEAQSSLALLEESLDALKVGLELRGPKGDVRLTTAYAQRLRDVPAAREGQQKLEVARGVITHRFAVREDAQERIIDLLALSPAPGLKAYLYVDRTDELLVEQRHVMLERLATLGRALQGVAHELNTPLTTMQTLAKDLRAALLPLSMEAPVRADIDESLTLLIEESRRCKGLTQALLSTANEGRGGRTGQTALEVARRAVRLVGPTLDAQGEVLLDEASLDERLPVDADRMLQIVMNLVQNALRATDDKRGDGLGPRVTVRGEAKDGTYAVVIEDRGPGLPAEVKARLFEPFVTTRPMGEGTGLGLYTSRMIAGELGGDLTVEDGPDGGTRAVLSVPR